MSVHDLYKKGLMAIQTLVNREGRGQLQRWNTARRFLWPKVNTHIHNNYCVYPTMQREEKHFFECLYRSCLYWYFAYSIPSLAAVAQCVSVTSSLSSELLGEEYGEGSEKRWEIKRKKNVSKHWVGHTFANSVLGDHISRTNFQHFSSIPFPHFCYRDYEISIELFPSVSWIWCGEVDAISA